MPECVVCRAREQLAAELRCDQCREAAAPCRFCALVVDVVRGLPDPACQPPPEGVACATCAAHARAAQALSCAGCTSASPCLACERKAAALREAPCAECTLRQAVGARACLSCAVRDAAAIAARCEPCVACPPDARLCRWCRIFVQAIREVPCKDCPKPSG